MDARIVPEDRELLLGVMLLDMLNKINRIILIKTFSFDLIKYMIILAGDGSHDCKLSIVMSRYLRDLNVFIREAPCIPAVILGVEEALIDLIYYFSFQVLYDELMLHLLKFIK